LLGRHFDDLTQGHHRVLNSHFFLLLRVKGCDEIIDDALYLLQSFACEVFVEQVAHGGLLLLGRLRGASFAEQWDLALLRLLSRLV